jgi:hypothetical protein
VTLVLSAFVVIDGVPSILELAQRWRNALVVPLSPLTVRLHRFSALVVVPDAFAPTTLRQIDLRGLFTGGLGFAAVGRLAGRLALDFRSLRGLT